MVMRELDRNAANAVHRVVEEGGGRMTDAAGKDLAGAEKLMRGEPRVIDDAHGAGGRDAVVVAHALALWQREENRQHKGEHLRVEPEHSLVEDPADRAADDER
jgi:hypothetical protein